MKDHMRAAVDRFEEFAAPLLATPGTGAIRALLDTRDLARHEQEWIRTANDGSEMALQYRLLTTSIEIHASAVLAHWPDDPADDPAARKLGEVEALLCRDFREILNEGEARAGH